MPKLLATPITFSAWYTDSIHALAKKEGETLREWVRSLGHQAA